MRTLLALLLTAAATPVMAQCPADADFLTVNRPLEAARDAVADGRLTILADGGIRSGLDVVRMLALGANGVLLGRAWAYALAAGGEAAIAHMLDLVRAEMNVAMALTGTIRIADIDRSIVHDLGGAA